MAQPLLQRLQNTNAQNSINAKTTHDQLDADGDGKLSAKELATACNITILEAEEIIQQYDANGDGRLDPAEFEDLKQQILSQQQGLIQNQINQNTEFDQLDGNADGRLTAHEFAQACNITVEEAQNIIAMYDVDGDGTLDQDEFEDLKQQILAQQRQFISNQMNAGDQLQTLDQNYDGRVDANELAAACNITVEEAHNIILQYDANGDGTLDQDEFNDLKRQILSQQMEQITNKMGTMDNVESYDQDSDGKLDATELAKACNITVNEARNIIYQFDENGDGKLNPMEFESLKQQVLEQQRQNMTNMMNVNDNMDAMDQDGDRMLSAKELAVACNISVDEAQNVIHQFDANGDGFLDPQEFEQLKEQILSQQRQQITDTLDQNDAVQDFDEDGDGKLGAEELANACNIEVDAARNIILQYDANGDGRLDPAEFEKLKLQTLQQPNSTHEEKEQVYVTSNDDEALPSYQSAVPNAGNGSFQPYNQNTNAPAFAGNINKVDSTEYTPSNSNAKAFGVDIFAKQQPPPKHNNNSSPFGKPSASTYQPIKPLPQRTNSSPFGTAPQRKPQQSKSSPFGTNPNANKPTGAKPNYNVRPKKFAHEWSLGIKFDAQAEQIYLNVEDTVTGKKWRRIITKNEVYGVEIKQEYFRIGKIVAAGSAKYTYPPRGVGAVQVQLTGNGGYSFSANPI